MSDAGVGRREFMKAAGVSSAALETTGSLGAATEGGKDTPLAPETKFPKLAFATQTGYEGMVVKVGKDFNPYLSDSQIDQILATFRDTGCRIVSVECFFDLQGKGINHIAANPAEHRSSNEKFIHCLEFAHRLDCKFVGYFSGGIPGATVERSVFWRFT